MTPSSSPLHRQRSSLQDGAAQRDQRPSPSGRWERLDRFPLRSRHLRRAHLLCFPWSERLRRQHGGTRVVPPRRHPRGRKAYPQQGRRAIRGVLRQDHRIHPPRPEGRDGAWMLTDDAPTLSRSWTSSKRTSSRISQCRPSRHPSPLNHRVACTGTQPRTAREGVGGTDVFSHTSRDTWRDGSTSSDASRRVPWLTRRGKHRRGHDTRG